jgi:hypothetical protein
VPAAQDVQMFLLSRGPNEKGADMNAQNIREHMDVNGAYGNKLGTVDRVEGNSIKLTKVAADAQ